MTYNQDEPIISVECQKGNLFPSRPKYGQMDNQIRIMSRSVLALSRVVAMATNCSMAIRRRRLVRQSVTMNSSSAARSIVHEFDTRQSADLTIFDGSHESESKLAKQFWSSVLLTPPVESTLVCKEINQRVRTQTKATRKPTPADNKPNEELTAFYRLRDETQRIQAETRRQQQLRQLFFQQSKTNRVKVSHPFSSV